MTFVKFVVELVVALGADLLDFELTATTAAGTTVSSSLSFIGFKTDFGAGGGSF